MLVQDRLSGYIHEVPDYGYAEAEMSSWPNPQTHGLGEVYDGLGNSLGLWFLPKLIKGAVSAVKGLVTGGAAPPVFQQPAPMAPMPMPMMRPAGCPPCPPYGPGFPQPGAPYPLPMTRRRRRRRR
jgi:hypothetical protein